ncbi:unnamed protein product, partial [Prorocentrum cordatum]
SSSPARGAARRALPPRPMFFAQGGGFPGFPGGLFGGKGKGKGGIFADGGEDEDEDEDEDEGADGGMGGSFRDMFGFGTSAGGSERSSSAKREVDNTRLYALLGVEPSASSGEIKKAYHRMAMRHHPDKGGDPETFKDIQQAFEVLGDADKRRRYDQLGEEALDDDGASFRGGGPRRNQAQRTKDKVRLMWVTLEQLYTSVTRPLAHSRKVVDEVDGRPPSRCDACGGQGVVVQMIRLGPIVQQVPHTCPVCSGAGSSAKLKTEREVLDVFVEKGSPDGHKIVFHGRADEAAGCEAGDLVVVVREQESTRPSSGKARTCTSSGRSRWPRRSPASRSSCSTWTAGSGASAASPGRCCSHSRAASR